MIAYTSDQKVLINIYKIIYLESIYKLAFAIIFIYNFSC
jgi:hypothetical protein